MSALAIRSKAHWGYDEDQMRIFAAELTLAPEGIEPRAACVLERDGRILGYYTLVPHSAANVELEHLFVEPDCLRKGHGSRLLEHACAEARRRGFARMLIQSDPFAEGFYLARGAQRILPIPTNIPDRTLPLLELWL